MDRELTLAAARLARSAPESWERFLGALSLYSQSQTEICISSPLDVLQVNQGRAQASAALLRLLANAVKDADRIEGKSK